MGGIVVFAGLAVGCGTSPSSPTEGSIAHCTNHADDDGDGKVDCNDQDCWIFAVCADAGADADADSDTDADVDTDADPCLGDVWTIEVADSSRSAGFTPSLAIDAAGVAHVAYGEETDVNLGIKYATNASGAWDTEPVGDVLGGRAPSLALDDAGAVHMAWVNQSVAPYDLHHSTNASGAWVSEVARTGTNFSIATTGIVLDSADAVHIAHVRSEGPGAVWFDHTFQSGGGWSYEPVANRVLLGGLSIAIDRGDDMSIVTAEAAGVAYATNESGAWVSTTIADDGVHDATVAFGPDDGAHVVYVDASDAVRHAWLAGGRWNFEDVDATTSAAAPSFAVDADGALHVAYADQDAQDLLYATNADGHWVAELVDAEGEVGSQSSLALDATGRPSIAFLDFSAGDGDLLVARRCE